ncbi:DUF4352 domain-containing protein [Phytohabitans sp. ZYX-F-186]|uniref:DUF4352 domain-containing protein n=1 Tax=Phytohabitans maris TaxID=3071409 RepID=A0ABU0ZJT1_9ACTN|nr:DUF4352 domain-containing protein [Phytohabitans sp. ZYX-F-186]MDQ7906617.1 DUF4352 domain-containing protein [Phytohabitans sp. ZYX-F-186]
MSYPNAPAGHGPQQPYQVGHAMPPSKKKSNVGLIIGIVVGGFVVLCLGGGVIAAVAGNPETTNTADSSNEQPAEGAAPSERAAAAAEDKQETKPEEGPKTYRVGQTVRGGDFEFVVHGFKCGIAQVGNEFLNRKAQGTFCRVDVSAKNVTKKAHYFHADGTVTAKDTAGREFDADGEANIYGNKDGEGFLDEINPGNQVRAFVYFDIPKGAKLTTIMFDAGLFTLAEDAVVKL